MNVQRQEKDGPSHALRLVELYRSGRISDSLLVSGIADLVTAANVDSVMDALPNDVRGVMAVWIRSLPPSGSSETVYWPLPDGVGLSFREWLRRDETRTTMKEYVENGSVPFANEVSRAES